MISVIVPVYNAEKRLARCVDSILAQTFKDFECLLVDDGSTDNTSKLCDEYATFDDRIRVFHKENGGTNAARGFGVEKCRGEYVTFCDDDDSLPLNALEVLYQECDDGKYKIVVGSRNGLSFKRKLLSAEEYRYCQITGRGGYGAPWGKLFHRSLFNSHVFDFPRKIVYGEDALMNVRIAFNNSEYVKIIDNIIYIYISRAENTTHKVINRIGLDHELLLYRETKKSVPANLLEKYGKALIYSRLNGLYGIFPEKLADNSPLIDVLKRDIKKYSYRLSLCDYLILNSRSVKVIASMIKVHAILGKIKRAYSKGVTQFQRF